MSPLQFCSSPKCWAFHYLSTAFIIHRNSALKSSCTPFLFCPMVDFERINASPGKRIRSNPILGSRHANPAATLPVRTLAHLALPEIVIGELGLQQTAIKRLRSVFISLSDSSIFIVAAKTSFAYSSLGWLMR